MASKTKRSEERHLWWLTLVSGMASYMDAAAIVTSGIAVVMLTDYLNLDAAQIGVLSSSLGFSIAFGAAVGGRAGDRFGRRRVFLVTMAMIIAAAVVLCLAPSYGFYLAGIMLMGMGTGADLPVSLATISEAASSENRGSMVSFTQILWKIGIFSSQGFGAVFGDWGRTGAQIMYAHIGAVAIVTLIARCTIPESDRWKAAHLATEGVSSGVAVRSEGSLRDLLRKPYIVPFLGLIVFYSLINIGMNTNGQFGALMFTSLAGMSVSFYSKVSMVTTVGGFVLVFLLMKVIDGPHRLMWFVLGATCAVTGSLLPTVFGPSAITLTAMLCLWVLSSVFAGEPILKIWAQESFPTLLRSTAQGFIVAFARIVSALVALVTPIIFTFGPRYLLGAIATCALVGCATAFLVFRGRTETEFDLEDRGETADIDKAHTAEGRMTTHAVDSAEPKITVIEPVAAKTVV
ncbi:MFS transporter [Bifidobacterium simiarum]|nr:MFS transporter [Bifidobacterium simiarum]